MKVKIKEVKELLRQGKKVKVKAINDQYYDITNYIDKGMLDTYAVTLYDDYSSIKVSKTHRFFTEIGWQETQYLKPNINSILCEDNQYRKVKSIDYIGKQKIVDITVDEENAYFGNKMYNHNSGKSLVGAHLLASCQKQGGIAVYIDTETSVFRPFLEVIGIDLKKLLYVRLSLVEDIFETIESMITKVRETDKDIKLAILVDSLAGATTKVEMESDFDKDGWSTAKAIITSKAMRKITDMIGTQNIALIFTQQLRVNLGVTFGDKYTTSGGKALGFHSSVRIRLDKSTKIFNKMKDVIGMNIRAKIAKNRLGPPLRQAIFQIYFDRGIDDLSSWLQTLKERGVVTSAGAWYSIPLEDGTIKKFQSKSWGDMLSKKGMYDYVYGLLCDACIMKYKPKEVIDIDEIEISDEHVEE